MTVLVQSNRRRTTERDEVEFEFRHKHIVSAVVEPKRRKKKEKIVGMMLLLMLIQFHPAKRSSTVQLDML